MSLAHHVRERNWPRLEEAWTELILETAALRPALDAVSAAAQRKEIPRCLPLVREHAEMLKSSERAAEAAELLGHTMLLGGSPGELARLLFEAAQAAWGEEDFWEAYVEIADLHENSQDMRAAWRAFRKLLAIEPGRIIYHAKGWGLGKVEDLDTKARLAAVQFTSGRRDRFPFASAIEIFEFLDETDLRTLVVTDPAELKRRTSKEPLEVLRWVLERSGGRANQAGIKLAMGSLGLAGPGFTAWWRKAKKQAEASEWFELSGPATRSQVRLLDVAADPVQGLRRQLGRAKNLREALTRVRTLVAGGAAGEEVLEAGLDVLDGLAGEEHDAPLPDRLATWLFLREERGETPAVLRETVASAADEPPSGDPSRPPALWQLFQMVPGSREQERCIDLMREVLGEDWLDEAARSLPHAAPGMVRGLVEALETAERFPELISHYVALLARPTRNPALLVRLGERIETGAYEENLPPAMMRAQCLLQLAVHLYREAPGHPILTRTKARLSALLSRGEPVLLSRLLAKASLDDLRGFAALIETGVEREVDRVFTQVAIAFSPDVFRGDERPFWEMSATWTTRSGLRKHQEELRVLRDVKIPENAEAIGKAASFGDLSENSEWEAAIEEQRLLTTRAMELEAELQNVQLLENAALPPDTVAPGTRVTYREVDGDGEAKQVDLVGPWDVEHEGQVSYRSPFAAGMLGARPGSTPNLRLPGHEMRVEVLAVVPLDLGE